MENQKNYKISVLKLLLLSFIVSLNLFGSTIELTKEEKQWLLENPNIKLTALADQAPLSMINNNGEHEGILKDIFQFLSNTIGQNIELEAKTKANIHKLAKQKGFYGISSVFKTPKNKDSYLLTKQYMATPLFFFTKRINKDKFKNKNDLKNKKVAVVYNHRATQEYLKKIGDINIILANSPIDQMQKVLSGDADALIGYITYQYLINQYYMSDLVPAFTDQINYGVHIGVNPEHKTLQNILNKAISTLSLEELNKIVSKWIILPPINKKQTLSLTKNEKIWLEKHPTIKLASDIKYPPFESINNQGIFEGISLDYIKLIETRLGIKFVPSPKKPWIEILQMVQNKKLDLLTAAVATKQRKKYITFTKPYISHASVIFTQNDKNFINGIDGLKDKTIAIEEGYFSHDILKEKYPHLDLKTYKNSLLSLQAVSSGKVDAYIGNIAVVDYLSKKHGITNIKVSGEVPFRLDLAFGIRKELQEFVPILQKALDSITEEEKNTIYKKWITFEQKALIDYSLLWKALTIFTIILLIITYWNNKLKQEISRRKLIEKELASLNKTLEERISKEIQKNEEQQAIIFHQSRLAQMGEMLSMIAHQWRQPLNNVSVMIQSIVLKYKKDNLNDDSVQKFRQDAMKQINYMSNTIDDFRDFFKPEKQKEEFNIEHLISKSISLIQPLKNIDINLNITTNEEIILYGYKNEFGQAILNLLNNSKDALEQKKNTNKWIDITVSKNNEQILITIKDNAGGIKDDIIEKVFDPYFSTKLDKSGTGLGLYMTKVIIEEHLNGKITIENQQEGLTTLIYLNS